ncbi:MAG: hypothetical protein S4CHLAM7_13400 [Chlamydiae bacterium]|nr:hypothetical protein [Chlamydiota bacterium]
MSSLVPIPGRMLFSVRSDNGQINCTFTSKNQKTGALINLPTSPSTNNSISIEIPKFEEFLNPEPLTATIEGFEVLKSREPLDYSLFSASLIVGNRSYKISLGGLDQNGDLARNKICAIYLDLTIGKEEALVCHSNSPRQYATLQPNRGNQDPYNKAWSLT